ncbi:MAG: hypothetical protein R2710_27170 [Acidimicrobiales bacterium]
MTSRPRRPRPTQRVRNTTDLPVGDYRVLVDQTSLPGGLTQTYDDDASSGGSLDHRSGVITLTSTTPYLVADFVWHWVAR